MPARHAALAVAVAVVWGVNFVVIHVGLEQLPPLLFAALRFTLVAFPAVFFVRPPAVPLRLVVGVGLFLSAGQFGLVFSSMEAGMPAGLASLVLQLQAMFTIAFGTALLGERPGRRVVAGCALGLGGIAIIGAGRAASVPLGALLLCVAGAASWGLGNVFTRRAQAPSAAALLVWSSVAALPPLLILSLVLEGPGAIGDAVAGFDATSAGALLYVVVVSTAFGFGTWTWLMRRHPVALVAPFTLLVPVVGITTAWLTLGEVPTGPELAGAVVVLGGLAMTSGLIRPGRFARRGPRARSRAALRSE